MSYPIASTGSVAIVLQDEKSSRTCSLIRQKQTTWEQKTTGIARW